MKPNKTNVDQDKVEKPTPPPMPPMDGPGRSKFLVQVRGFRMALEDMYRHLGFVVQMSLSAPNWETGQLDLQYSITLKGIDYNQRALLDFTTIIDCDAWESKIRGIITHDLAGVVSTVFDRRANARTKPTFEVL